MSHAAAAATASRSPAKHNPWIVAIVISIATFMEVLDTTIANVALRNIAGGLAVGPDEAAWVVTSYLVANAIVLCASSWLAQTFGRKRFYMACVAIFSLSSVLCGFATSLQELLLFRVLQGLGGGGMAPVSQSILADSFPPEKRGQAFALYGVAIVVAPIVGPTLGGWITDNYSWHWVFLINAPVGLLSLGLVHVFVEQKTHPDDRGKRLLHGLRNFDLIGFALIAACLGSLEIVLDQGQRDDWFGSNVIVFFTAVSVVCFLLFLPWGYLRKNSVIDLHILFSRQFGACFLVMLGTGGILISTVQILPQLLQDNFGYTATLAGLALSPGGMVTMVMMPIAGRLTGIVQPRYLIMTGAAVMVFAMYNLTNLYSGNDFSFFVWSRVYIGIGLPLIFVSITSASYEGIPPDKTDQASALINVGRNLGGSIFVSIAQTVLAQRQQFHQSRLVEHITPADWHYQSTLAQATQYFIQKGATAADAARQALAFVQQIVQQQASFLAYIDVFVVIGVLAFCMIPLAMLVRPVKQGKGAPSGAH
ncbi:MAG: DHA2 family efflux MFS transporter permease subunit [Methylobacteriaceae bacterium]|nr:DHA2 family efflux MFS transporter permease subunit [Methylobacteriaceae bacterium]